MEILGLLDALESAVLDGFKIPLTKKTMVDEEKILNLVDKIRLVVEKGSVVARKSVEGVSVKTDSVMPKISLSNSDKNSREEKTTEVIQQAYQMAKEIRGGADHYADEVLSHLEATTSRILRTVKAGRDRLKGAAPSENTKEIVQEVLQN